MRRDGARRASCVGDAQPDSQKMAGRPDMLLQFCHYIADVYEKRWGERPIVTVESLCSLNGRAPRPLINSEVDLASQPRNLWPADWIQR